MELDTNGFGRRAFLVMHFRLEFLLVTHSINLAIVLGISSIANGPFGKLSGACERGA